MLDDLAVLHLQFTVEGRGNTMKRTIRALLVLCCVCVAANAVVWSVLGTTPAHAGKQDP